MLRVNANGVRQLLDHIHALDAGHENIQHIPLKFKEVDGVHLVEGWGDMPSPAVAATLIDKSGIEYFVNSVLVSDIYHCDREILAYTVLRLLRNIVDDWKRYREDLGVICVAGFDKAVGFKLKLYSTRVNEEIIDLNDLDSFSEPLFVMSFSP